MEKIEKDIIKILETPFWPESVDAMKSYFITHDDCDGDISEGLRVTISNDGDVWVSDTIRRSMVSCRFRTHAGGGRSLRVRNALLILAMAIKLEGIDHPQKE